MTRAEAGPPAPPDFPTVRKGFEPDAVRAHVNSLGDELRRSRADSETARLEAERLRRELDEARAELISQADSGTDTNEAIAILGAEANRIIGAAQESSKEIVAAAEAAAEDVRAKAREEALRIGEDARRESADFDGRLSGQADEVRVKLREEIRRARAEFAEEAERLRADARYEAEKILEDAREEARVLRAEADSVATERGDAGAALAAERLAAAESAAEAKVAQATARAETIVAEAESAKTAVLAELHAHRETLETHVRSLQEARGRVSSDLSAVRTTLAGLAAELDHVRLRDVSVPPLALDFAVAHADAVTEAVPEAEADAVPEAEAEAESEAEADAEPEAEAEAEIEAEDGDDAGTQEVAAVDAGDDIDIDEWDAPGDAEIDALFDRVVAQRGESDEPAAPAPAVRAGAEPSADEDDWGFADDVLANEDTDAVTKVEAGAAAGKEFGAGPHQSAPTETRRRVFAALHKLATDTGEVPLVSVREESNGKGGHDVTTVPGADADAGIEMAQVPEVSNAGLPEPIDDSAALDLVPSLIRKVKRALQEVENAALDTDLDASSVDVLAVFAEYLDAPATEAVILGLGGDPHEDLGAEVESVIREVCARWADELGAGLTGADPAGVAAVVRNARDRAEAVAVDLARTAYRSGRERAASLPT